jgi:hypothetical protein
MNKQQKRQTVGFCKICRCVLYRDEAMDWFYYKEDFMCLKHKGVVEYVDMLIAETFTESSMFWLEDKFINGDSEIKNPVGILHDGDIEQ